MGVYLQAIFSMSNFGLLLTEKKSDIGPSVSFISDMVQLVWCVSYHTSKLETKIDLMKNKNYWYQDMAGENLNSW